MKLLNTRSMECSPDFKDIQKKHQEAVLNAKIELITRLLCDHLKRNPNIEDYKLVTLGNAYNINSEFIMIDGIEYGHIELKTSSDNNSIKMTYEFIPKQ